MGIPALVLLYAGIDGMAWVSIPDERLDVTGGDFRAWVRTYLLPDCGLDCDDADLWAARCGLVHAQIMDSRSAREGKGRHIWYYVGPGNVYLIPIHEKNQRSPITVHIDHLVFAFKQSANRFFEAIEANDNLQNLVWPRAQRYFDEVRVFGKPGEDTSWIETIPPVFGLPKSG